MQHLLACNALCEKPESLSEQLIKNSHKILMEGLLDDDQRDVDAGNYRKEDVCAGNHLFIPPNQVEDAMKVMVEQYLVYEKDPKIEVSLLACWLMVQVS